MGSGDCTRGWLISGGFDKWPCYNRRFYMTRFDFTPLFRIAIGFDRLAQLTDMAASAAEVSSYPPYNIERTGEDTYRLTMAVAGFHPENLEVVVKDNNLVVSGRMSRACLAEFLLRRQPSMRVTTVKHDSYDF